ncbi:hypothetical protein P154DRAFT_624266 [Amniculicola lignicola CBS 123094]|uniref:Uncharacterized protein n=1 Tax=Amniculicola lignicola CBS 123094 TaxID=1392246 RepID=A0A6A5VZF5_9PLEO|nr:hypothetical protein P154DRAFT_624266 [Amniculicola lignicola CBS 123094]
MRLSTVSLACLSLSASYALESEPPLQCFNPDSGNYEACNEPLPEQLSTKGGVYARLRCVDCPVLMRTGEGASTGFDVSNQENDLFFNLTIAHDRKALFLNSKRIFPRLPANPPPEIYVPQIPLNFSRHDLDVTLACVEAGCGWQSGCSCIKTDLGAVRADFDYSARQTSKDGDRVKWQITFDTIGGHGGVERIGNWVFGDKEQKMLSIVVEAKELASEDYPDGAQAGSPFGEYVEAAETEYEIQHMSLEVVQRSYTFPRERPLSIWNKMWHYFGFDPVPAKGHIIYLHKDWDDYGKKGSLKNTLGKIWNDWPWDLIFIIVGSVVGGLVVLYLLWRLFSFVKQEWHLTRWDHMDEVWERMRQDEGEEEAGLLHPGWEPYRDEDTTPQLGEGSSQKPLPSKPLPEKPLPDIPLIDAI